MTIEERKQQRYTYEQFLKWGSEIRHWQDGGEVEIGFEDGDPQWIPCFNRTLNPFDMENRIFRIAQPKAREGRRWWVEKPPHIKHGTALVWEEYYGPHFLGDVEGHHRVLMQEVMDDTPTPRTITVSEGAK
jgi:hypothetical protein